MDRRVCEFNGMTFELTVVQYLMHRYPKATIITDRSLYSKYLDKETQIDVIMVHPNGVFVIEAKNWKKMIRGELADEYWTGVGKGVNIMRVFNPFNQNTIHIRSLRNAIRVHTGEDILPFENIVCLPDGTTIDSVCSRVCNLSMLGTLIDSLILRGGMTLDVDSIVEKINAVTK